MSGWKKLAAASAAGGGGLDVDEVFSTYLYKGNGSSQTITNGIDLDGEGGLVWTAGRDSAEGPYIWDTERGVNISLATPFTGGNSTQSNSLTSFNSNGFSVGSSWSINRSDKKYVSWTFRKAPKFVDIVTYTGNGPSNTQNISHNLGSAPGMMVVRATSTADNWHTWHRGFGDNGYIMLNATNAKSTYTGLWDDTAPTATHFTVSDSCNTNNATYVAYLFAHNDGDGEFGPDSDQDIIKCGIFTGAGYGSADEFNVDLGFEPQWILVKRSDNAAGGGWFLVDNMRGWRPETSSNFEYLLANTSGVEQQSGFVGIRSDGFRVRAGLNRKYIYMAIRRGPLAPPDSGTEVFDVTTYTGSSDFSSFSGLSTNYVDATANFIRSGYGAGTLIWSRLAGSNSLKTWSRAAEGDTTDTVQWDFTDNKLTITGGSTGSGGSTYVNYFWKRAPGFFDVVAYTGDGTTARAIPHNLGVAPEMMMHKRRDGINDWYVPDFINSKLLLLNYNLSAFDTSLLANYYGSGNGSSGGAGSLVTPDASTFTVTPNPNVNASGGTYIAYLFASLPGISKVGSYTGNGSSQTINCGFTSGARFILIKRTDSTGDWYVWDTERGIVAGNDPYLELNTSDPEVTNRNWVNPDNSGFIVSSTINVSSASYIFYAIA